MSISLYKWIKYSKKMERNFKLILKPKAFIVFLLRYLFPLNDYVGFDWFCELYELHDKLSVLVSFFLNPHPLTTIGDPETAVPKDKGLFLINSCCWSWWWWDMNNWLRACWGTDENKRHLFSHHSNWLCRRHSGITTKLKARLVYVIKSG